MENENFLILFKNEKISSTRSSINKLIGLVYSFGEIYVKYNSSRFNKLLKAEDIDYKDFIIDSIASLFVQDDEGVLVIQKLYNNWQPPISTESEFLFFLQKSVSARIEQHLNSLLRESDPFFSKTLDSVNYLIQKDGLKKIRFLGKLYITQTDFCLADKSVSIIEDNEFDLIPMNYFLDKKNLFPSLFAYLKESNYSPLIHLYNLVLRLRDINKTNIITFKLPEIEDLISVDSILTKSLESVNKKLGVYVLNKKLTVQEKELFEKILMSMVLDLKEGGLNSSLFEYFSLKANNISKKEYQTKYHNILEYLLKSLKKEIRGYLSQSFN